MRPWLRKLVLLAHITSSVGWLGAAIAYLLLAFAGFTASDAAFARGVYLALELLGWYAIVPLCLVGFVAGLAQSLGTHWGLFRHYWIATKLIVTTIATAVLLTHMQTVSRVAALARDNALGAEHAELELQLVLHAALGVLVLVFVTAVSVYKPWGRTSYGRRARAERVPVAAPAMRSAPAIAIPRQESGISWRAYLAGSALLVGAVHLAVHGLRTHWQ